MGELTWILVADTGRARLFLNHEGELEELTDSVHTEGRQHIGDMVSDSSGRRSQGGQPHRPTMGSDRDPKEVEARRFAKHLAVELKRGLDSHACDSFILVAPPHFLGLLRQILDPQVARRVLTTLDQDLTHLRPDELIERIHARKER
ncbi:MAG: host attachment protein [Acidobacteria bacterium]|nr:host attachment protein [Acidobacteriota bacterium]